MNTTKIYLTRRIFLRGIFLLAVSLFSGLLYAAESGTVLKADDIRREPFRDAKSVTTLAVGDAVSIIKQDGGWLQISKGKSRGWVRMLSIRRGDVRKGGTNAKGVLALTSGRAGTGKVVATTGIRGLTTEELKQAQFNEDEVKLAESYASSKVAAAQYAAQGKLVARRVDYLGVAK